MLKRRAAAFDNPDRIFELKYDGFRALLEIDGADARLVSRNRNRFKHLDMLAAALAKRLRVTGAILDGEIICADESGLSELPSVPRLGRRLPKLADRHDDAQPLIGAFVIALPAHLLYHPARFRRSLVAIKLDEEMR